MAAWVKILWLSLVAAAVSARADEADPYGPIRSQKLYNGLTVVLAPSGAAKTFEVELRFLAGWNAETQRTRGVARLTERVFVRDERVHGDQTFQQRVREAGGEASGATGPHHTSFYASVPSIRGIWVLNEMANLLPRREIRPEAVERARREILLELGEPRPWLHTFFTGLVPGLPKAPDFFETEFRVPNPHKSDPDRTRRDLARVRPEQVQAFHDAYYRPSNAVLFVAGPFKQEATFAFIRETFERHQSGPRVVAPLPTENPRVEPYRRSRVADRDSRISVGVKFWDISAEEEIVLKVYFEYLAHRLTRRLRGTHGQSYGAEATVWVDDRRFGYAHVSFQTPRVYFRDDLAHVKDLLERETLEGDLSDESIRQAREVYGRYLEYLGNDADTMARLASRLFAFQTSYGVKATPYTVFRDLPNQRFREHLRGLFHPRKSYLVLEEPPLYFQGESTLLYLLAVLFSIALCRRRFLGEFDYTTVRYVRKVKYQPVVTAALAAGSVGVIWTLSQGTELLGRLLVNWPAFQSSFLFSQYLQGVLSVFLLVSGLLSYLCLIPRKVIVTDRHLILKSLSYYSRRIDVMAIRDISVCRPLQLFTHHLWSPRVLVAHWTPWKKGVLLRLENGRGYYLGFRDAQRVAEELRAVLRSRHSHLHYDAA